MVTKGKDYRGSNLVINKIIFIMGKEQRVDGRSSHAAKSQSGTGLIPTRSGRLRCTLAARRRVVESNGGNSSIRNNISRIGLPESILYIYLKYLYIFIYLNLYLGNAINVDKWFLSKSTLIVYNQLSSMLVLVSSMLALVPWGRDAVIITVVKVMKTCSAERIKFRSYSIYSIRSSVLSSDFLSILPFSFNSNCWIRSSMTTNWNRTSEPFWITFIKHSDFTIKWCNYNLRTSQFNSRR